MQDRKGRPENTPCMVRAAEVRGTAVVNLRNEDLGKITDLISELRRGLTPSAAVSFGRVFGIARDSVAVPLGSFARTEDDEKFVLQTTGELIENAPDFNPRNWDSPHDETLRDKIARAFGQAPDKHGLGAVPRGTLAHYMLASSLEDAFFSHFQGARVGTATDLIIDRYSGELAFIFLKSGGVAGMGTDTIPVPWSVLHRTDVAGFQIPVSKHRLDEAPRLERNNAAILAADPSLCDTVREFFGVTSRAQGTARGAADHAQARLAR